VLPGALSAALRRAEDRAKVEAWVLSLPLVVSGSLDAIRPITRSLIAGALLEHTP
jgi:hypothetical protein